MNIKIADLMVRNVIITSPHETVGHVKQIMHKKGISAIPVINDKNEPMGIVSSNELQMISEDQSMISEHLSDHFYQVPSHNDVSVAAKIMLNHHIHHVIVTKDGKLEGIISSFDLLKLIDEKRLNLNNKT